MQYLFNTEKLSDYLDRFKINLRREIESSNPEYLLNVDEEEYRSFLVSKYSLQVPVLKEYYLYDKSEVEKSSGDIPTANNASMYSGELLITIAIPFVGERHLFKCAPSTHSLNPPLGDILQSEIRLQYQTVDRKVDSIKSNYVSDIDLIKNYLLWMKKDIDGHNDWTKNNARKFISERKTVLLLDQTSLQNLGLPIRQRENLPDTYSIPIIRKKTYMPEVNLETKSLEKPEPVLSETMYECILETILHMSLAMERSPKTFWKLSETEIRDFFVIILNSHYEGQATGETFNYNGKTDILIRVGDANTFIAECKFWDGERHFLSAIDQILGYASWRDTKTAVLLFNRNQNFAKVLAKIREAVKEHKFFKKENQLKNQKIKTKTISSYIFKHPSDIDRELFLTVMAFDISPPSSTYIN